VASRSCLASARQLGDKALGILDHAADTTVQAGHVNRLLASGLPDLTLLGLRDRRPLFAVGQSTVTVARVRVPGGMGARRTRGQVSARTAHTYHRPWPE